VVAGGISTTAGATTFNVNLNRTQFIRTFYALRVSNTGNISVIDSSFYTLSPYPIVTCLAQNGVTLNGVSYCGDRTSADPAYIQCTNWNVGTRVGTYVGKRERERERSYGSIY
jgi:hypothetical protein